MQKWEYLVYRCNIISSAPTFWNTEASDVSQIWANQPNSDMDRIKELGSNGWELVSVTPVVSSSTAHGGGGVTTQILFSFKRPIE